MVISLVMLVLAALPFAAQLHKGDVIPPIGLIDQDGHAFSIAGLRGQPVVLSFVYTRCTTSCALTAAKLAAAARTPAAHDISVLAVTVDPAFDRPAALRRYRTLFGAPMRWRLATGSPAALSLFERRLGVEPKAVSLGRTDHDDVVVILDSSGRIAHFVLGDAWTPNQVVALAHDAGDSSFDPTVAFAVAFSEAFARCGRGIGSFGFGPLVAIAALLALACGIPLVRLVNPNAASEDFR